MNTIHNTINMVVGMGASPAADAALRRAWTRADHTGGTATIIGIPVTISARHGPT